MTPEEAKAILALAENGLRIEPATKMLYLHRSTLCRRIQRIKKKTGMDPLNFFDMQTLVPKAKQILGTYGRFFENGGLTHD